MGVAMPRPRGWRPGAARGRRGHLPGPVAPGAVASRPASARQSHLDRRQNGGLSTPPTSRLPPGTFRLRETAMVGTGHSPWTDLLTLAATCFRTRLAASG